MAAKDIYEDEPNLVERGNIDLNNRPRVKNPDGSVSTVFSMSFNLDNGPEIIVPRVADDGTIMDEDTAVKQYLQTGKHLGKFKDTEAATRFAQKLHLQQESIYTTLDREVPTRLLSDRKAPPEIKNTRERLLYGMLKGLDDIRKQMSQQLIQQKDAEIQKMQRKLPSQPL